MKKRILIIFILVLLILPGCTQTQISGPTPAPTQIPAQTQQPQTPVPTVSPIPTPVPTPTPEPQEVTISGSTSVEPFAIEAAEAYMKANPHIHIKYQGIGSSAGISNAAEGVTQIGTASRELKTVEKEYGMEELVAGYIAVAVVVNKDNPVDSLNIEQLRGIFTGRITNWSEVGGPDEPITVFIREQGSGLRGHFEELIDIEDSWGYFDEMPDNISIHEGSSHITSQAAFNTYTIVYSDIQRKYNYNLEKVKLININGYALTYQNVQNGSYPLYSPFYFVYHDENLNAAAREFLDYIVSPQGQSIAQEEGLVPITPK